MTFPRAEGTIKPMSLPEDVYIKKFYKKYPDSKYQDPIKYGFLSFFFLCVSVRVWIQPCCFYVDRKMEKVGERVGLGGKED